MESMKENEGEWRMKENVVFSFLKCFKHVQNMLSTSLDRLCSTIKSPFFVPSSSSSASKHTTNGQLTEIDSHCTTLHTDSTIHNIPWKRQPASAAQAPFGCLREALRQFIPWCPLCCPIWQCSDWSKTSQGKWSRVSDSGTGSSNSATPFKHQDVAWYVKMFTTGIVFAISIPTCCGWF